MAEFPDTLAHPNGVILERVPDRVLIATEHPRQAGPIASAGDDVLGRLGLVEETGRQDLGPIAAADALAEPTVPVNSSETLVFARTADGSDAAKAVADPVDEVNIDDGIAWAAPVYAGDFGGRTELISPAADAILIEGPLEEKELAALEELGLRRDGVRSSYLGDIDYFVVDVSVAGPAYAIRDRVVEIVGPRRRVSLEFVPLEVPIAVVPNDPFFAQQWNMERIGLGGAGSTGWDVSRGSNAIIIAVLDQGCDLAHPDLVGRYVHNGINLGTMGGTGAPTGNHGTPCAGIAAATTDNAVGVAGVAGGSRILPIAFAAWTAGEVAAGLRYAADQGANVVSMSFGSNAWDRTIIDPALQYAADRGVVLVAATHNHNTADGITYPATNPLVIAVGASDQADGRKNPASPDGETWGSNFGNQISVVAPGVRVPAPDRLGAAGYTSGDYTMTFNGTSAATPHVAGLAALLLSVNSRLGRDGVRRIIEQTAAKTGTVPYATVAGRPNGTWNREMGYGRIDANAAVRAARPIRKFRLDDGPWDIKRFLVEKQVRIEVEVKDRVKDVSFELPDEVKRVGYENPDFNLEDLVINPVVNEPQLDEVKVRLERIEKLLTGDRSPFISADERPDLAPMAVDEAIEADTSIETDIGR